LILHGASCDFNWSRPGLVEWKWSILMQDDQQFHA
jgi:hypothetical protein